MTAKALAKERALYQLIRADMRELAAVLQKNVTPNYHQLQGMLANATEMTATINQLLAVLELEGAGVF